MSLQHLIIRHGQTDANRVTRAAFGKQGAPLNESGIAQAKRLQQELLKHGIDLKNELVAVSELLRTRQTAEHAGLVNIAEHGILNEISTPNPQKTTEDIKQGILPPEAIATAKRILANPPKARIWVTHGLVIAAIMAELGMVKSSKIVPEFCEVLSIKI